MSIQVTLQRKRHLHVSADGGVAIVDRWHLSIEQARRKTPLRLVRPSVLEAFNIARELCRANGWPLDWRATVLKPIVTTTVEPAVRAAPGVDRDVAAAAAGEAVRVLAAVRSAAREASPESASERRLAADVHPFPKRRHEIDAT